MENVFFKYYQRRVKFYKKLFRRLTGPTPPPQKQPPRQKRPDENLMEAPTLGINIEKPGLRVLHDVTVVPRLGVINADGRIVEASRLRRRNRIPLKSARFTGPVTAEACLDGRWVYGGLKIEHFGHFLLESMARLWAVDPGDQILWTPWREVAPFETYQTHLIDQAIGNGHTLQLADAPTRVAELVIPDPGYLIPYHYSETLHRRFARLTSEPSDGAPVKIWLSRSALPPQKGCWVNECDVEDALTRDGWRIYHPEQHSIAEQLQTLGQADVIAGSEGSAFHLLVFFRLLKARIIIFKRDTANRKNFRLIADRHGFDQMLVPVPLVHTETKTPQQIFEQKTFCDVRFVVETLRGGPAAVSPKFAFIAQGA